MKIIKPSIEVLDILDQTVILKRLELVGRTCYKSEDKITDTSCVEFVRKIIKSGHHAIVEHYNIAVKVICDRGVTHEIVRHRISSYAQESTRYCNYGSGKFGNEITVIDPCFWRISNFQVDSKMILWRQAMENAEKIYLLLIEHGATPQEARSVLPNSLKTEIIMTMNLREWRHFLTLRTSKAAHPQMREIANMILSEFKSKLPVIFEDISNEN
mgnify:CR=1 FL=1